MDCSLSIQSWGDFRPQGPFLSSCTMKTNVRTESAKENPKLVKRNDVKERGGCGLRLGRAGAATGAQPPSANSIAASRDTISHQQELSGFYSCSQEYLGPCCLSLIGQVPSSQSPPSSPLLPSAPAMQWEMLSWGTPARPSVSRAELSCTKQGTRDDFKHLRVSWVCWAHAACVPTSLLRVSSGLKAAGKGIISWVLEETKAFPA